jgi:uncharacterized membrane protein YqjE
LKSLSVDLREMLAARWELAKLELQEQSRLLGNLVAVCILSAIMALTALPLLVWCLADRLDGWLSISRHDWLLYIALGLLGVALVSTVTAIIRFRCRVTGLQETLEELQEDLVWLRDWTGKEEPPPKIDGKRE